MTPTNNRLELIFDKLAMVATAEHSGNQGASCKSVKGEQSLRNHICPRRQYGLVFTQSHKPRTRHSQKAQPELCGAEHAMLCMLCCMQNAMLRYAKLCYAMPRHAMLSLQCCVEHAVR